MDSFRVVLRRIFDGNRAITELFPRVETEHSDEEDEKDDKENPFD